jgi:hypothetical protein
MPVQHRDSWTLKCVPHIYCVIIVAGKQNSAYWLDKTWILNVFFTRKNTIALTANRKVHSIHTKNDTFFGVNCNLSICSQIKQATLKYLEK